jgi:hypothetical protein
MALISWSGGIELEYRRVREGIAARIKKRRDDVKEIASAAKERADKAYKEWLVIRGTRALRRVCNGQLAKESANGGMPEGDALQAAGREGPCGEGSAPLSTRGPRFVWNQQPHLSY